MACLTWKLNILKWTAFKAADYGMPCKLAANTDPSSCSHGLRVKQDIDDEVLIFLE
jgi:hypothetical protein